MTHQTTRAGQLGTMAWALALIGGGTWGLAWAGQPPAPGDGHGASGDPAAPLYGVSLMAVRPPKARQFAVHDLITIVVDETSRQEAQQSLKTDKKAEMDATLDAVLDPRELLELRLRRGNLSGLRLLDVGANNKFDAKGTYQRSDRFSMKIQARVIEVKPNGTLLLEARKVIDKDGESVTTVLSGLCRPEDVTANNTVFSSQLAELTIVSRSEGQVKDAARKGLITRVLETLFAF